MLKTFGRSVVPDYSQADPNRHTIQYCIDNNIDHREIGGGYYLRQCDYPYDTREEHRLLMYEYTGQRYHIKYIIKKLQKQGYTVLFNSTEDQSQPTIRHGHALRGYKG